MDIRKLLTVALVAMAAFGFVAPASVGGSPIQATAESSIDASNSTHFEISDMVITHNPIHPGEQLVVSATVTNTGSSGTDALKLYYDMNEDGSIRADELVDAKILTLDSGEQRTIQLTQQLSRIAPGNYRVAVETGSDSEGRLVEIVQQDMRGSDFHVRNVTVDNSKNSTEQISVNATVENIGDQWSSQRIGLRIDTNGDGRLTENETVDLTAATLDPHTIVAVEFQYDVSTLSEQVQYGVFTRDDHWTTTFTPFPDESPQDGKNGSETNPGNSTDGDPPENESEKTPDNSTDPDRPTDPDDPDEDPSRNPVSGNNTTDTQVQLTIVPNELAVERGNTTSVSLRLVNATEGLDSYDLFVRTDDAAAVEIVDFDPAVEARVQASSITDNGSAIRLQGAKVIDDGTGVVRLGTVEFSGADRGAAVITTDTVDLGYSSEDTYAVTREGSAIVRVRDANSTDGTPNGTGPDPVEPVPDDRVSLRLTPVGDGNDTVGQNGSASDLTVGANRTYELVASNLTDGLEAATLRVVTTNSSAVAIVDGKSGGTIGLENQTDQGGVTFDSVHRVESGTATLGRITVAGQSPGEANVTASDVQLYYDGQTSYEGIDAAPVTVSVAADPAGPPPVVDDTRPTDPDGDGLYEDVDGDGEFTILDVSVLLNAFDEPIVRNNAAAFDFDDNGTVTIIDVSTLLNDL
jgi:hypothetical protein